MQRVRSDLEMPPTRRELRVVRQGFVKIEHEGVLFGGRLEEVGCGSDRQVRDIQKPDYVLEDRQVEADVLKKVVVVLENGIPVNTLQVPLNEAGVLLVVFRDLLGE